MKKSNWVLENGEWVWKGKKKRNKPFYLSMQMIRRVRYWLPKDQKKVFDAESDPDLMDSDIEEKARLSGLTAKLYTEALRKLNKQPTPKLMLTVAQIEKDFISNWYKRITEAIKWAEENKDYKAILAIEKEKTMIMKRLIATGRLISPFESEGKDNKEDQQPIEMRPDSIF